MSQELIDLKNRLVAARDVSQEAYNNWLSTGSGEELSTSVDYQEYVDATRPEREVTDELIAAIERLDGEGEAG